MYGGEKNNIIYTLMNLKLATTAGPDDRFIHITSIYWPKFAWTFKEIAHLPFLSSFSNEAAPIGLGTQIYALL